MEEVEIEYDYESYYSTDAWKYSIPPVTGDEDKYLEKLSEEEKFELRPVAEILALLDGSPFFGHVDEYGTDWYEAYLIPAKILIDANGGREMLRNKTALMGTKN